ncbi:caspase, EACC1-associated type [Nocardia heshunensis]
MVVGSGSYTEGSALPPVSAVAASVTDIAAALTDHCDVRPDTLTTLIDPVDPSALYGALKSAMTEATDTFVLYFVGHGLLNADNELYLATFATDHLTDLTYKALPYSRIRDLITHCPARTVVVILDCCFAGRARGNAPRAPSEILNLAETGGAYLLAAASSTVQALAPIGDTHTAFTGALLTLLTNGDPGLPPLITIEGAWRHLRRELPTHHAPAPVRSMSGRAGDVVLALNPAAPALTGTNGQPPEVPTDLEDLTDCPYRGLQSFTSDDAAYFFGRDAVLSNLLEKLADFSTAGLSVVVGTSGVGKTSLLHAGLLPAVARGDLSIAGSGAWPTLAMTPGPHPVTTLAQRLSDLCEESEDELRQAISEIPADLTPLLSKNLPSGTRLLMVIDQFEETFTTCTDESERQAFITALTTLDRAVALIVVGLRADFYAHCWKYPDLLESIRHRQIPITPMTIDDLTQVIDEPARLAGLTLEPGLTTELLQDLADEPDRAVAALPLLSYALQRIWSRRSGATLTLAGYASTGGIRHAVAQQAENAYTSLAPTDREAAKALLLRMIHLGTDTEDTRRSLDIHDLLRANPRDTAALEHALGAFVQSRLVSVDSDTAQIAHDALLRAWPRLRQWIAADRAGLLVRQQLRLAAAEWDRGGRNREDLYRGTKLADARLWARQHGPLDGTDQQFLTASAGAQRRIRIASLAVVALLVAVIAGIGVVVKGAFDNSDLQHRNADFAAILAESDRLVDTDPSLSAQLVLTASRIRPSDPAVVSRMVRTEYQPLSVALGTIEPDGPRLVGYSGDGNVLAAEYGTATEVSIRVWSLTDMAKPHVLVDKLKPTGDLIEHLVLNNDGTLLVVSYFGGNADLWDISQPGSPRKIDFYVDRNESFGVGVAFDPTDPVLAMGEGDGVHMWNYRDPARSRYIPLPLSQNMGSIAISHDGTLLAVSDHCGALITLVSIDGDSPAQIGDQHECSTARGLSGKLVMSPNRRYLASSGHDGSVRLWDIADLQHPQSFPPLKIDPLQMTSPDLAFADDSTLIVVDQGTKKPRVWNLSDPLHPTQLGPALTVGNDEIGLVAVGPAGRVMTENAKGELRIWTLPTAVVGGDAGGDPRLSELSFSSDARLMSAVVDADQVVDLFNLSDPYRPRRIANIHCGIRCLGAKLSPDGKTFAVAFLEKSQNWPTVMLYDLTIPSHPVLLSTAIGAAIHEPDSAWPFALKDFSPDSRFLIIVQNQHIRVWDLADRSSPQPVGDLLANFQQIGFSPDGKLIAVLDIAGKLQLWRWTDEHRLERYGPLLSARLPISSFAFHPNLQTLTTVYRGGKIQSWTDTGETGLMTASGVLDVSAEGIRGLEFVGQTGRAVVSDTSGSVRVWDLSDPSHPVPGDVSISPLAGGWELYPLGIPDAVVTYDVTSGLYLWSLDLSAIASHICSATGQPEIDRMKPHLPAGFDYRIPCP